MRQCMDADNLHRRLKKIVGQVQAIDRMVDEDVPCEDVLAQINAAKSALHRCGHRELHEGGRALLEHELGRAAARFTARDLYARSGIVVRGLCKTTPRNKPWKTSPLCAIIPIGV